MRITNIALKPEGQIQPLDFINHIMCTGKWSRGQGEHFMENIKSPDLHLKMCHLFCGQWTDN